MDFFQNPDDFFRFPLSARFPERAGTLYGAQPGSTGIFEIF
jgi:hypothetical protein